ncbi:MAG: NAD(P)-binding protein [Cryomorphaceae bacterium]|nr:NAD(P)-binding protein [Cryomorphaceae bacterium]
MNVGIIGAGHNGLVAASYLARDGFDVEVFERSDHVGGLCVSEELFEGFKVTSVASYYGMLRKEVVKDMELEKHGLEAYLTDPAEIVLFEDGNYIFTPRDGSGSKYSIDDLTDRDLSGWNNFWSDIGKTARLIAPYYFKPDSTTVQLEQLIRENNLPTIADSIFRGSLLELAGNYFSNEKLKSAVSTCTPGFASLVGTVYGCIHHGTAETSGVEGAWGLVRGGMGSISEAMRRSLEADGVKVKLNSEVTRILLDGDKAQALEFKNGIKKEYDYIISTADHNITFGKLIQESPALAKIPSIFKSSPSNVSAGKLHFSLKAIPEFPVLKKLGHNYSGIIVFAPSLKAILADSLSVQEGQLPSELMMTLAIPSVTDDTVAPPGKHILNVDVHCLPARINGGDWTEEDNRNLLEQVLLRLEKLAPSIRNCIEASFVVSPQVLRTRYNLESMCCWQLSMTEFPFDKRNINNLPAYHTPIENLFLAGAGTFGGGNVTGVSGYNCAKAIARLEEKVAS